jgi:Flp pilus assembly protein TadG
VSTGVRSATSLVVRGLSRLRSAPRDRGVVAVLTALLMTVFLGVCALTIDVGSWYLVKARTQQAADAAALAAVVNLPDNFANAQTTAAQFAALNGFPQDPGTTTVTTKRIDGDLGSLSVTVSTTVANVFTGLFGVPTSTISSTGNAAYSPPLKMGSPCNRIGSDPDKVAGFDSPTCDKTAGGLWVNVNAPGTAKEEGDPFTVTRCTGFEDECLANGTNKERASTGYLYDVTVKQAGPLKVEIFDGPWVDVGKAVGNQCNSDALLGLNPTPSQPKRYASGDTSAYCTGDSLAKASPVTHTASVMNTTFTLRSAQGDPLSPETHAVMSGCKRTYSGYEPKDAAEFSARLSPGDPAFDPVFTAAFRKWSTLCTLGNVEAGTYVLQVGSSDDIAAGNRFAMRATGANQANLTISGHGSMDLFANDKSQNARFYLARTPTSSAGQTLHVRFYDVGECDGGCTLSLVAPNGVTATGCTTTGTLPISGCSFTPDASFNGRWIDLLVAVPKTYTCADSDPGACWYSVQYTGGAPHDVTAWTATMDGQPVRIVP